MWIKNYTASSVREALSQIKNEMGVHAVILDTRVENGLTRRSGGSGARVTVTAAIEQPPAETAVVSPEPATAAIGEGPRTLHLRGELAEAGLGITENPPSSAPESVLENGDLAVRVANLERELADGFKLQAPIMSPAAWWTTPEFHAWLDRQSELKASLTDAYAGYLLDQIPEPDQFLSRDRLPATVCFVGPPGSGKSTLVMKTLALRWRTHQASLSVAEIVGDHVPSGGRLAGWAEMFGLEWKRFRFDEAGRLSRYLSDLRSDSVFIKCDLSGESEEAERAVKKMVRAVGARITVVVLSSLVRRAENVQFLQRSAVFQPTHVCFSHWDLAQPYDDARHVSAIARLPLAYHTAGPAPCDQIEPFTNTDLRVGVAAGIARFLETEVREQPA